ncbi:MAG: uncharacterized protein JWQ98_1384 [Chlorobi bacterium]|nr:uncharacterized protein [Chlorobiota bacterium]
MRTHVHQFRFSSLPFIAIATFLLVSCEKQRDNAGLGLKRDPNATVRQPGAQNADQASIARDTFSAPAEEYGEIVENDFLDAAANRFSTFSIDVDAASYSNVRRFLTERTLPPRDAVRIEEMVNYFPYDYPEPTGDDPFSITAESAVCPWNPAHRLVHVGLQGRHIDMSQLPPSNLTFLIDVSGSMEAPNKLPLLKDAFHLLVNQLRPEDRVAIVVYAGAAGVVLEPTSGSEKGTILKAIDDLQSGGSTAGGEGITLAYDLARRNFKSGGNNRVILATDGDFNVGVSDDDALVRLIKKERSSGVFLSVIGVGEGNLQDHKMEQLADNGNGNYSYIDGVEEAKKVFATEMGATLFTIAKDVKVQVEFNPARVKSYHLIGYENRLLRTKDFSNDRKDAGELGAGHAVTAIYEVVPSDGTPRQKGMPASSAVAAAPGDPVVSPTADMLVKLRYKAPNGTASRLISRQVEITSTPIESASNNLKFSAAVAGWGQMLRNSKYKGNLSFDTVLNLARSGVGADPQGYRTEFLALVETSRQLSPVEVASR